MVGFCSNPGEKLWCWTRMVAVEAVKSDWNMDIFEGRTERIC